MRGQSTARLSWGWIWILVVACIAIPATALGQTPAIVRVEEDWELVVAAPDSYTDAPQVTCVICPLGNVDSLHVAFDLNHQNLPSFISGGLQLQVWEGETAIAYRNYPNPAVMVQAGETVTWTQRMALSGGQITFEIVNGNSLTWGRFGGQGYLKHNILTTLSDLNGYLPSVSVDNSGVGYAGNRVQTLTLKAVRAYTAAGEVFIDSTPRTVYPRN